MLSHREILEALDADKCEERLTVVPKPSPEDVTRRAATSLDLRLGRWFRSFKQTRTKSVALVALDEDERDDTAAEAPTKQHFVPFGKSYILHPGRFVLGATLEWLHLPKHLSGYVT